MRRLYMRFLITLLATLCVSLAAGCGINSTINNINDTEKENKSKSENVTTSENVSELLTEQDEIRPSTGSFVDQEIKQTDPLEEAAPAPYPDESVALEPSELAVLNVCELDDIFSPHGDAGEIVDRLAGEFERQSPDDAVLSDHEMALMLDRLGDCIRNKTTSLVDGQEQLVETVQIFRDKGLAMNTDIYLYHEQVEGGGSMYVAMANSFPGILEIHLHQYVQRKLDQAFSDSDPETFDSLYATLQDMLEEKKMALQEDEVALGILDRIGKTIDEWVDAMPEKTVAERDILQMIRDKVQWL